MGDLPSTRTQLLHIVTLSAFAVAQPLFDLLGRNASFFVAHRARPVDVIVFTTVALLVVPAVLVGVRLAGGVRSQVVIVGALGAVAVVPPVVRVASLAWPVAAALFAGCAALLALVYARWAGVRRFVTILSPVVILFPALFLSGSQVRDVLTPRPPAAASDPSATSDVPVMTVLFDELSLSAIIEPSGRIDRDRFPNFARLAGTSTWFRGATTSGLRTDQAVPAILTGRRPAERQVPSSFAYPDSIFTMLAPTHRLHVHEFVTQLCPDELCPVAGEQVAGPRALLTDAAVVYGHLVLPPDLAAEWLPPLGDRWAGFARDAGGGGGGGDPVRDWLRAAIDDRETQHEGAMFERFIRDVRPAEGKPMFAWMHVQLPHPPWRYLPDGTTYPAGDKTPGYRNFRWTDDQYLVDEVLQRSLLQAKFADVLLGRLLDHLEDTEQIDDMMLTVIADHGATWQRDATRRDVDGPQGAALLGVPLFVKYPGQDEGRVDDRVAETVDLVPTIADVTGVETAGELHGRSLQRPPDRGRTRLVFDGSGERRVRYDLEGSLEQAKRIERLFGPSREAKDDLYGFGPHRDLLGQWADDLRLPPLDVRFDRRAYADVDPGSGSVPAFFRATVDDPDARRGTPVAVVVNGRIAGVGQTYVEDGRTRVAVMLAPHYFERGRNRVSVHEIR